MIDDCRKFISPLFRTSAIVAGLVCGYYHRVFAGICTGGAGTYSCSGAPDNLNDVTQYLTGSPLTVTTSSGFGITTTAGGAFYLSGTDGLLFNDPHTSSITGASTGITAYNSGNGPLVISTSGSVTGVGTYGIAAYNAADAGLSISAHDVSGYYLGIYAYNASAGDLSITTSGTVAGTYNGIRAINIGSGNLHISATHVTSGYDGIAALNIGNGDLVVTTSGSITGLTGFGIYTTNVAGPTTITVGPESIVQGRDGGIGAGTYNEQPITITVNGQVRNISESPSDLAIVVYGAPATLNLNRGSLVTGIVLLHDYNDTVNLSGTLNGSLQLEGGNDTLNQVGGSLLTGTADGGSGVDTLGLTDMGTLDGKNYSNFENLAIYGGSTNLIGNWNFSGGTATIYAGNLSVNGTLYTSLLTVGRGSLLGGSGNIFGDLSVYGTLAPGNSIGTMTVAGGIHFMPGSTFAVDLGPDGSGDLLRVTGMTSINDSTLRVSLQRALYEDGTNWRILNSSGGISGRFSSIRTNLSSETIALQPYYSGGTMGFTVRRTPYAYFGSTPNQKAVGTALNALLPSATGEMANLLKTMDFTMNSTQLATTLNGLNPEILSSFTPAGFAIAETFDRMANIRQQEFALTETVSNKQQDPIWSVWGRAVGNHLDRQEEDGISGYTFESAGVVFGLDRNFGTDTRAGVMLGYNNGDLAWEQIDGNGSTDAKHIGLYGSTEYNDFVIDVRAGFTDISNNSQRLIKTPYFTRSATGNFDSDILSAALSGTWGFTMNSLSFGPKVSLDYLYLNQDDFQESGGGDFSLNVKSETAESLSGTVSLVLSGLIEKELWRFQPTAEFGFIHQFINDAATMDAYFANYPGSDFTVTGMDPVENGFLASAGITFDNKSRAISLFLNVDTVFAEGHDSQLLSAGLVWKF